MLAYDFTKLFSDRYELVSLSSSDLDIKNFQEVERKVSEIQPDVIINCAAYTKVDDAEDIGMKDNYDVNSLWVYNLAKVSSTMDIDFITISTDYVFFGDTEKWYVETQNEHPINQYGMAKYLWEKLALWENKNSIIVRTSWLYWWGMSYKNFVNTMIQLGSKLDSLKIINDQYWNPTNCKDLSIAIWELLENIEKYRWQKLHFSNTTENHGITWYDFAQEIFSQNAISVEAIPCTSSEFPTKASRPSYSKLINNSDIQLRNWKEGLKDYLDNL